MVTEVPCRQEFARIAGVLGGCKNVVILEHEKPDGDCIGSGLCPCPGSCVSRQKRRSFVT